MNKKVKIEMVARSVENGDFPNLDKYLEGRGRHYVSYMEDAKLYKISYYSFMRLVRETGAYYCLRKNIIMDMDMIEKYPTKHPNVADRIQSVREV